jgi:hypothetical protein
MAVKEPWILPGGHRPHTIDSTGLDYAVSAERRGPLSYDVAYGGAATGTLFEPASRGEQVL